MIDLYRVRLELPGRVLFDDLSFRVNDTDRVALVGPNGAGKTTLLRIMAGLLEPDSGQVSRTRGHAVGYLPQEGIAHAGRSIVAEARSAFDEVLELKRESEALEVRLEAGEVDEDTLTRYADLLEEFRRRGGYEIDGRVASVLDGLGFRRDDWEKDASHLSGGWQMRLALAKLLIRRPELLLLDEPTNHLDLLAATWLEEYLDDYEGGFVLVSHDRHFLDNVVTHVAELRGARARVWTGNYTHYLEESEKEIEQLEHMKRRQDERIEKVERFISKFRYKATKAKQVQSRLKELQKIERIELPSDAATVNIRFPDPPRSGRRVVELEGVGKAYAANRVFAGVDLTIERGDRLALVGPNGAGKSTLIRILAGREEHEGTRRLGHNVSFAYFAQDEGARLDPGRTILDELTRVAPVNVVPQLRGLLGAFLFRGDDVFKPIEVLSGGEKTRVALAKMLLEPHNLLLLDEPTNHLDLASKEVLLGALEEYSGTIVIVSHDRYFVDHLADRIADVGNGQVITYPGGYEDYLSRDAGREHAHLKAKGRVELKAVVKAKAQPEPGHKPEAKHEAQPEPGHKPEAKHKPKLKHEPKHKPEAELEPGQKLEHRHKPEARPKPEVRPGSHGPGSRPAAPTRGRGAALRQRQELEKKIEAVEAEVKALEARMAQPGFFADPRSRESVDRHQALMWQVKELYDEWDRSAGSADT